MKCFECGYNGGHHPLCGIQSRDRSLGEKQTIINSLKAENAVLRKAVEMGKTGLMYAYPALTLIYHRFEHSPLDDEARKHLYEAICQVERSQKDMRTVLDEIESKEDAGLPCDVE